MTIEQLEALKTAGVITAEQQAQLDSLKAAASNVAVASTPESYPVDWGKQSSYGKPVIFNLQPATYRMKIIGFHPGKWKGGEIDVVETTIGLTSIGGLFNAMTLLDEDVKAMRDTTNGMFNYNPQTEWELIIKDKQIVKLQKVNAG